MKTLLKTIAILCLLFSMTNLGYADNDSIPPTPVNPIGNKIEIPINKRKLQRTLFEPVQAYYYVNDCNIELVFNENVGSINVCVSDSNGAIIYTMQHDTSVENGCDIFIPCISDCYYIDINGENYIGTGHICI